MLVTKNKSKDGKTTYVNFVFKKTDLKECKNADYVKASFQTNYEVGLSNQDTVEIGALDIAEIKVDKPKSK